MTKDYDTAAKLRSLLSRYVEVHRAESCDLRAELDQLGMLLADAVTRLTSSFEMICALSARQRQFMFATANRSRSRDAALLRALPAANEHPKGQVGTELAVDIDAPGRDDLSAITTDIERYVKEAVTALQFQDIASQLLGHAVKRMELLERMAGQLERLSDAGIEELSEAWSRACTMPDGNPVDQTHMSEGTVELFE